MTLSDDGAWGCAHSRLAGRVGLEPTTSRLTAGRSTIELHANPQKNPHFLTLSFRKQLLCSWIKGKNNPRKNGRNGELRSRGLMSPRHALCLTELRSDSA